jgi:hypothetical protein
MLPQEMLDFLAMVAGEKPVDLSPKPHPEMSRVCCSTCSCVSDAFYHIPQPFFFRELIWNPISKIAPPHSILPRPALMDPTTTVTLGLSISTGNTVGAEVSFLGAVVLG